MFDEILIEKSTFRKENLICQCHIIFVISQTQWKVKLLPLARLIVFNVFPPVI